MTLFDVREIEVSFDPLLPGEFRCLPLGQESRDVTITCEMDEESIENMRCIYIHGPGCTMKNDCQSLLVIADQLEEEGYDYPEAIRDIANRISKVHSRSLE